MRDICTDPLVIGGCLANPSDAIPPSRDGRGGSVSQSRGSVRGYPGLPAPARPPLLRRRAVLRCRRPVTRGVSESSRFTTRCPPVPPAAARCRHGPNRRHRFLPAGSGSGGEPVVPVPEWAVRGEGGGLLTGDDPVSAAGTGSSGSPAHRPDGPLQSHVTAGAAPRDPTNRPADSRAADQHY